MSTKKNVKRFLHEQVGRHLVQSRELDEPLAITDPPPLGAGSAENGWNSGRLPEAELKLALMACIDEEIRRRYRTLRDAADECKINRELLSSVRCGRHRRCSVASLLRIAERFQIHIRIDVQLLSHRKR